MASPEIFAQGFDAPAGIAFDADDVLYVCESKKGDIQKIQPDGKIASFLNTGGKPTGIAFDDSSDMFIAESGRHHLLLVSLEGEMEVYASTCNGKRFNGPRHIYFSPDGNLLFTDSNKEETEGSIYSVDLDGEVSRLATGLEGVSGLVISEDATSLYVSETSKNRIVSMELGAEDELGPPEEFIQFDDGDRPGALLFDKEGTLYVARSGVGLTLIDPDARIIDHIALPGNCLTGMIFGGLNFDQLYIAECSTGSIYYLQLEHSGQRPFAGPRSV